MLRDMATQSNADLRRGTLVMPAPDLMGMQGPDGTLVLAEKLGPGRVEQTGHDNWVYVRWLGADYAAWVERQDLRSLGPAARIITIQQRDRHGHSVLLRRTIDTRAGLKYNWTVESLPNNVVRAVRDDGASWTFIFNRLFNRLDTYWPEPREDEDAEALSAAESVLSSGKRGWPNLLPGRH